MGSKLDGVFKGIKTAITVAGVVAAVKGIGDALEKAGAVGDTIDESSQKLGLSRKAYQEWGYVLKQNGGNIESFGVAMKTLQNSMVQGTAASDAALKLLGLSAAKLKTLSPEDALKETIAAFQKMPEGAEKSAAAVDLFGKQGMELLPTLNMTTEATEGLIKQANDLGIVLNDETIDAGAKFSDTLQTMKDTVSAAGTSFLTSLLPGITKVMDKLIPFFSNVLPKLGTAFGKVFEKIEPLVESLVGGFTDAITWIADNADTLIPILEGVAGAILLWNGYQAILNITMAANPIGAVITAVAFLAGGLVLLNDAFNGTSTGMSAFNASADKMANDTTDFSDLVAKMTPNILDVNSLISSTGKTVGELQATIKEKEDAITAILKSAMEDHRTLRQDELDDIAQYNLDIASLNDELIEQYRSVELAKLRQIQLEAGDMTVEQMAQYEADMKAALASANKTSEDAYTARLATIENTHKAIGDIGSAAYLKEQQDAKANYHTQLEENKAYYDQAQSVFLKSSAVLVGAEKKQNADLNIEYQTGLDNITAYYDKKYNKSYNHYKSMDHMDSAEAQRALDAANQWQADQLAVIDASRQPELDAIQSTYEKKYAAAQSYFTSTGQMESDYAKKYFSTLVENREKELAVVKEKYDPQLQVISDAYDAQYNEIYNKYGRVNELETTEAQNALATIKQRQADETAAWIALYDEKQAAAESSSTDLMQTTDKSFAALSAAQEKYNADITAINDSHYGASISALIYHNNATKEANSDYGFAYKAYLDAIDTDAWSSFLYQYDVAKQAGDDIPPEYTQMVTDMLNTFATMPADMQEKGKAALLGLTGGIKDPTTRASLDNAAKGSASDVVTAIKNALGIGNSGGGGGGNPYGAVSTSSQGYKIGSNIVQALAAGMENERRAAGTKATSIGSWIIQAFKNVFGIHSHSAVMRDQIGKNIMGGWADGITDNADMVTKAINGVMPDTVSTSVNVTRNFNDKTGNGGSAAKGNIAFTYNVYANDTSYAEQQRIAQNASRTVVKELSAFGY
jgi:hypothetical protein